MERKLRNLAIEVNLLNSLFLIFYRIDSSVHID